MSFPQQNFEISTSRFIENVNEMQCTGNNSCNKVIIVGVTKKRNCINFGILCLITIRQIQTFQNLKMHSRKIN